MDWKRRLIRTAVLAMIGILIGALIAGISILMEPRDRTRPAPMLNAAGIGGPWTLTDHNGQVRSSADFGDSYKLIYFGFTYCPAICPTELQKIAAAYTALAPSLQEKIQPLFVTVDPERDDAATLKSYVALFHPKLVGLTGSMDEIETAKKTFKVYAAKVPDPDGEAADYTMDHSSFIYLMTPGDELLTVFKIDTPSSEIAAWVTEYFAGLKR